MTDYALSPTKGRLGFFDKEYNLMPFYRREYKRIIDSISKPSNYEKMIEMAEKLSKGFPFVRVDFYNINGNIYFGEMTFTPSGGIGQFEPDEFDIILGEKINLELKK